MQDCVQVHASIPKDLKKRAFIALAEREKKFTPWLREQLERLLNQSDENGEDGDQHERG